PGDGGAVHPAPPHSLRSGLPAGVDRRPRPGAAPRAALSSRDAAGPVRRLPDVAVSRGAPLALHALRRPADQALERAHQPLVLRRGGRGGGRRPLRVLGPPALWGLITAASPGRPNP